MLKKTLLIFLTLFFTICTAFSYDLCLKKGTLVKVYTKIPLSTENLEEGSQVYFIAPSDVWVVEEKAIEQGDIFYGHVSMLKLPVQGINAAMSIEIDSVVNKYGEKRPLKGKLIFSGSDVLGGNLTNPTSYNTTIHPRKVYGNHWGGSLQYVPSGEYEFGHHVSINTRDLLFVEFLENFYL